MFYNLCYFTADVLFEDFWEGSQSPGEIVGLFLDCGLFRAGHRWDCFRFLAQENDRGRLRDDVNREGGDGRRMWERIDTVDGKVCCILAWNMCICNIML